MHRWYKIENTVSTLFYLARGIERAEAEGNKALVRAYGRRVYVPVFLIGYLSFTETK